MNSTKELRPAATVILLTLNGERYLDEVLAAVISQRGDRLREVLVIDSGSSDATLAIARRYPVRIETIPPEAFNHGETRNLGGRLADADSEYLVYLTQDATPLTGWLDGLLQCLDADQNVAGAFSRHAPRADCNPILAGQMVHDWPQCGTPERVVKRLTDVKDFERRKLHYVYFANTSSCVRRSVWERYPFSVTDFAEDAQWAAQVLSAGYTLVYEPASTVRHSHSYSLVEQCRQNFDHARAMQALLASRTASLWGVPQPASTRILHTLARDRGRLSRNGALSVPKRWYWFVYTIFWHAAASLGMLLGGAPAPIARRAGGLFSRQRRIRTRHAN